MILLSQNVTRGIHGYHDKNFFSVIVRLCTLSFLYTFHLHGTFQTLRITTRRWKWNLLRKPFEISVEIHSEIYLVNLLSNNSQLYALFSKIVVKFLQRNIFLRKIFYSAYDRGLVFSFPLILRANFSKPLKRNHV